MNTTLYHFTNVSMNFLYINKVGSKYMNRISVDFEEPCDLSDQILKLVTKGIKHVLKCM